MAAASRTQSRPMGRLARALIFGALAAFVILSVLQFAVANGMASSQASWRFAAQFLIERALWFTPYIFIGGIVLFCFARFHDASDLIIVGFTGGEATAVKGPDGDRTVWIGRTYGTEVEAQTVADLVAARLARSDPAG